MDWEGPGKGGKSFKRTGLTIQDSVASGTISACGWNKKDVVKRKNGPYNGERVEL